MSADVRANSGNLNVESATQAVSNKVVITWDILKKIAPGVPTNADVYVKYLNETMEREAINETVDRVAMFLAQALHECQNFRKFTENLNYRAERLMQVWPARFPSRVIADKYAHRPEALANYVYANRYGNGNEASGDGHLYRGKGIFMITFKDNHEAAGIAIKGDRNAFLGNKAQLLTIPEYSVSSAGWFWKTKGLNQIVDRGDNRGKTVVEHVTLRINGGYNGIEGRTEIYNKARQILSLS